LPNAFAYRGPRTLAEVWEREHREQLHEEEPDPMKLSQLESALESATPLPYLPGSTERVRLRRAAGVTQTDAAAVMRVTPMTVVRWEQGCQPRKRLEETYRRMLSAFVVLSENREAA
jgi:DNA-binding transcriptional regulator YiaG